MHSKYLKSELPSILSQTISGTLPWRPLYHPEDESLMCYKAVLERDEDTRDAIYLSTEKENGGFTLSLSTESEYLMCIQEIILHDHVEPSLASQLNELVQVVVSRYG